MANPPDEPAPHRPGWRWASASWLGFWLLAYGPHLFSGQVPYYRDLLLTYLPMKAYLRERLLSGQLPQWFPYEGLGTPFIGQLVTATFHPLSWLLLPLQPIDALKTQILLCYLLGGLGALLWARALEVRPLAGLGAATVFALSGYLAAMSNNPPYLLGTATLPFVGWAATGLARAPGPRTASMLAVMVSLVLLAGDAQGWIVAGLLVIAALVAAGAPPRVWGLAMAAAAGSLVLGAVELLPNLHVASHSLRQLGRSSPTLGLTWALHPRRLPELIVSGWVPDAIRYQVVGGLLGGGTALWASRITVGATALTLVPCGLYRRRESFAYAGAALLGLWLALGDRGGLLWVVRQLPGPFDRLRYPEKWLALTTVALVPLVAWGIQRWVERPRRMLRPALVLGSGLLLLLVLSLGGVAPAMLAGKSGRLPVQAEALLGEAWSAGAAVALAALAVLALLGWLVSRKPRLAALVPVLALAELLHANGAALPLVPRLLVTELTSFDQAILARGERGVPPRVLRVTDIQRPSTLTLDDGPGWVAAMRFSYYPDTGAPAGIATLGAMLPGSSARLALLVGSRWERAEALASTLHACFKVANRGTAGGSIEEDPRLGLSLAPIECAPLARLEALTPVRDGWEASRAITHHPDQSVWEGPAVDRASGEVKIVSYQPERIEMEVAADRPGGLVLADAYDEGWTATVGGVGARVHPVNVALRGVEIPAGPSRVVWTFRSPWLRTGLLVSAVGWVVFAALLLRRGSATPAALPGSSGPLGSRQADGEFPAPMG